MTVAAATTTGATTIVDHWHDLVTVSLLGTDRREPPPPPAGPVGDVVADAVRETASGRMLAAVAATVVARRAGLRPHPPVPALAAPPDDDRPMIGAQAARRWHQLVRQWPVLEDEWLAVADAGGWRPSPDVAVGLLRRHRQDAHRRPRACHFVGPLAGWLVEQQPQLAAPHGQRSAQLTAELPVVPVPPELLSLLPAGPSTVVPDIVERLRAGAYGLAHRGVLVNFVARARPDVLDPLATALRRLPDHVPLTHALAELAAVRAAMLDELAVRR